MIVNVHLDLLIVRAGIGLDPYIADILRWNSKDLYVLLGLHCIATVCV